MMIQFKLTSVKVKVSTLLLTGVVILFSLLLTKQSCAQAGALDLSFNTSDIGYGSGDGTNGIINATAIQNDGKIIIAGNFTTYNGTIRSNVARVNADGSLDATFDPGSGSDLDIQSLAIQSDGKIIIGGNFTFYNGTSSNRIARLNADGSLDATFNSGTGANNTVNSIAIQSDGKIIIGGNFTFYNGTGENRITRLNTNGSIDATFANGTGANNTVYSIAIQSDGKIIIGGIFTTYNGTGRNQIARLNSSGSNDTSFNPGTGANNDVLSIALQSDEKIIIGGTFTTYNGVAKNRIARLNTNGSLDATFAGTGANNTVYSIAIQSDDKIIIGGIFTNYIGTSVKRIARVNTDGSPDVTFNTSNGANDFIKWTSIQNDGKIIIGGAFTAYDGTVANYLGRVNTDGSLDATFNLGNGANGNRVHSISKQNDGKIIIGGEFTGYNGASRSRVARANADGSLDVTFNPGIGANFVIYSTSIQNDGKIIIGGAFTTYDGTTRNRIARLNTDGSLDATFNPGTGANSAIHSTYIQSDGKIIIGGAFTTYNGVTRNRIARLNMDGSLDATFDPSTGANNTVKSIAIQSDGKIIIGGSFTTCNGTTRNRIARVNINGSHDLAFNAVGTGANSDIESIAIQSDGKIIIGGSFTTYNGTARSRIVRVSASGSLDATFDPGAGANGVIFSTEIQSDGKIVIGGLFTLYNGTIRRRIARVNADGSLDATFNPGTGANNSLSSTSIYSTAIQSDGKIIIGGDFTSYDGTGRNRVARIYGAAPTASITTSPLAASSFCQGETIAVPYTVTGTFNPGNIFTVQLSDAAGNFASPTSIGALTSITSGSITSVIPIATPAGTGYRVRVVSSDPAVIGSDNGSNLVVNSISSVIVNETACDSYTWALNGTTYTSSGTYTHVGTNGAGCPLTTTLNLTINTSTTASVTETACDSYTWALNGTTYTTSGTYTHVVTNAAGCPLTTTLNLTINTSTTASVTETACDSYTWALNGTTYTSSGTYTHVGTNGAGCPLTTTLNLTINTSTTASVTETACDSYTWALNGTTYTSSGTYTHVGTNGAGCPLTTTLNLTINTSTTASVTETACDSYTWALNGTTYTSSGTYTHVGTNGAGCPLTTTLNLTINTSTTASVTETACDSYTWALNGTTYTSSGTYTHVGTNGAGCTLTTTLNLTINTVNVSTTLSGITITANASGVSYQWIDCNDGNAIISGAIVQSFTATANGSYAVIVTTANCSDTSACQVINSVGINEMSATNVEVYPNPTEGMVTISSGVLFNKIEILNALGQKVGEHNISETSNYKLTLPEESGVYLIKVGSNESSIIKRVVKN